MLQAIIKKGKVYPEETPIPVVSEGSLLIKVINSCISVGTESSNVSGSKKSIIKKAMQQPERVIELLKMAQSYGFSNTIDKVKNKIETGTPTGYSLAGIVVGVGKGVTGFAPGDKVTAAGSGIATHAEYVDVPQNLVMKMPDNLDFVSASTVTMGGIALQGVRRIDLNLGEYCVVMGAGILGLLAVQMLKISGVRVIAVDLDEKRLSIAKELGAEITFNPRTESYVEDIINYTGGYGVDGVLFTAATKSNVPLSDSFKMCKKKGRVVLVGVSGMEINREDIYVKELDFMMSTSYGPGRYDDNYEKKGLDYPYSYVRWTENRNMTEYLRLLSSKSISIDKLLSKIYPISEVTSAYDSINQSEEKPIMVILEYDKTNPFLDNQKDKSLFNLQLSETRKIKEGIIKVGLIGAGGFATRTHLPNFEKLSDKFYIKAISSRSGYKSKSTGQNFKAEYVTTDYEEVLNDKDIDLIVITTRHGNHAELVLKALRKGKHVLIEKPLAVNTEELEEIKKFIEENRNNSPLLMVGFNRRFSKYAQEIKKHVSKRINPLFITYNVNAGYFAPNSWVHEDGGRIIGEGCHFIDLMTYLTDAKVKSISLESVTPKNDNYSSSDNKCMVLKYNDGSVCNINYFSLGNKAYPKERMEVHFDGKTIFMNDYKTMDAYGLKIEEIKTENSEKGHIEELIAIYDSISGTNKSWPIEFEDLYNTTKQTIDISNFS